jgi:hypothetical protein
MKRFIIIGAILAGAAVWILIAHQEVFTMDNEKKHKITFKADGSFKKVQAHTLTPGGIDPKLKNSAYKSPANKKLVAIISYYEASPGCWEYLLPNGETHVLCW